MPQGGHNIFKELQCGFNQFLANILILNPLKTPENQRFSVVLKEYRVFVFFEGQVRLQVKFCKTLCWINVSGNLVNFLFSKHDVVKDNVQIIETLF